MKITMEEMKIHNYFSWTFTRLVKQEQMGFGKRFIWALLLDSEKEGFWSLVIYDRDSKNLSKKTDKEQTYISIRTNKNMAGDKIDVYFYKVQPLPEELDAEEIYTACRLAAAEVERAYAAGEFDSEGLW